MKEAQDLALQITKEIFAETGKVPIGWPKAADYAPVIHILRQQGAQFREIRGWFEVRHMNFTHNALYTAYQRFLKKECKQR